MKKNIGKFILQSLIIFAIWFVGQLVIYIVDFENGNAVSIGWFIIVIVAISIYRTAKGIKNTDDNDLEE